MLDLFTWLFGAASGDWPKLVGALMLAGTMLILVNVTTKVLSRRIHVNRQNAERVRRALVPVEAAATALLERLLDICVRQRRNVTEAIRQYDETQAIPPIGKMNRHHTTAERLGMLLAAIRVFKIQTRGVFFSSRLETAEFFLHGKIPVALRGNVYGTAALTTEEQEAVAESFLPFFNLELHGRPAAAPDLSQLAPFRVLLRATKIAIDPIVGDEITVDHTQPTHQLLFTWLHCIVYLIDFLQTIQGTPRWDDVRLLVIRYLQCWHKEGSRANYLYRPNDLERGSAYLGTFPQLIEHRMPWLPFTIPFSVQLLDLFETLSRWWYLRRRGRRFVRRHELRKIRLRAVVAYENGREQIYNYSKSPAELRAHYVAHTIYRQRFD